MLDTILNNSGVAETITFFGTLTIIVSALIIGLFISFVYIFVNKNGECSKSFIISLIMLPAIIAMIILLVGNNVARAFSLAGAFSLIRFRSAPGDSKDITFVFFSLAIGLACGMGYIGYALLFAVVLSIAIYALVIFRFGNYDENNIQLKIIMAEDMDYHGVFDDIMHEYTLANKLIKVKTAEFGSLFELTYDVTMKDISRSKEFIDKLRCKNGNLSILLLIKETKDIAML